MAGNPSVEKVVPLETGEISKSIMEQNEFFRFRDAWTSLPDHAGIIGEARSNG